MASDETIVRLTPENVRPRLVIREMQTDARNLTIMTVTCGKCIAARGYVGHSTFIDWHNLNRYRIVS